MSASLNGEPIGQWLLFVVPRGGTVSASLAGWTERQARARLAAAQPAYAHAWIVRVT